MIIEPYYQIFKDKLKEVKFKELKLTSPTVSRFKKKINPDLEKNGLLCPLVLDSDGVSIRSGGHRYEYFKDKYESTLCYVTSTGSEAKFLQLLHAFCWRNHPVKRIDYLMGALSSKGIN